MNSQNWSPATIESYLYVGAGLLFSDPVLFKKDRWPARPRVLPGVASVRV